MSKIKGTANDRFRKRNRELEYETDGPSRLTNKQTVFTEDAF